MPITEAQRKERVNYIGGSDAAAVMGMSRWTTPIQLWSEKAGVVAPEDISGKFPVRFGTKAEDIVAEFFEEETGLKVKKVKETIYHKTHKFIAVNLDRRVVGEDAFVELKTSNARKKHEWEGDEIPKEYLIQCQHGLMVTGFAHCYIGVVFGNEEFVWKKIERDDEFIALLEKREVEFWQNFVVPKVMPKQVMAEDTDVLNKIYPYQVEGSEKRLGDEAAVIAQQRQALLQDKAMVVSEIDRCDAQLKAMMGEFETGRAGQYKITYKHWSKKEYMVKASEGRTLRVTEDKNGNK